jgi:hypothetical protein
MFITSRETLINTSKQTKIAAISDLLFIRKHIANIYEKLHVNSKAHILSLAHKNKWV